MKKISLGILVLVIVVTVGVSVKAATPDEWPMFHHDLALSGVSASTGAPDTNRIAWASDTGSSIESSPAIVDGILYIGAEDGNLYAFDVDTGLVLWVHLTGSAIKSSPAVEDSIVYFLSADGDFHALDAYTGGPAWGPVNLGGGPMDWSSPAVHDGNVFVGSSIGSIYNLVAATGSIIWVTNVGGSPNNPITVVNGKVYSGTNNVDTSSPTLVALSETTGEILWSYNHHLQPTAAPRGTIGTLNGNGVAVVDGDGDGDLEVYFGLQLGGGGPAGSEAVCLDEATGDEIWTQSLGGNSTSTPAVHDGKVYIGSDDTHIYALDAATGIIMWAYQTGAAVSAAPAVADGKVFVGSLDHKMYAFDETTGGVIWSYDTGASRFQSSPAIAYGNVYAGNENGIIYAFSDFPEVVDVVLDVKPASCPNPLNVDQQGTLPAAILGTGDFDVTQLDPESIFVGPEGGELVPAIHWDLEDVAAPYDGGPPGGSDAYACTEDGPDGFMDLTLKFDAQAVAAALVPVDDGQTMLLSVIGSLTDGTAIKGVDVIVILNKGNAAPAVPSATAVLDAYPVPFNPDVWMPYKVGQGVAVKITIYSASGHLVRKLDLGYKDSGDYVSKDKAAYWDGRNEAGELASSGIYFYTFQAGSYSATKKLVMIK